MTDFILGAPKSLWTVTAAMFLGRKAMTNLDSVLIKQQRYHFTDESPYNQSSGFSISHVQMC